MTSKKITIIGFLGIFIVSLALHLPIKLLSLKPIYRKSLIIILFLLPIIAYRTVQNFWSVEMSFYNKDVYTHLTALRNAAPNDARCIILNDKSSFVFSYLIDKQGYIFGDDFPVDWVKDMILRWDAKYVYSNSAKMNNDPEFLKFCENLILDIGSVKVFKLKSKEAFKN